MEIIQLAGLLPFDTMLSRNDMILMTKSEDDIQYSVYNLNNIVEEFFQVN
jgi:hypothetical protein